MSDIEPEVSQEATSPYPPQSIVLAKVKGYPPWPAMVLDEAILPANIVNKRPKSTRGTGSTKKKPAAARPVPVRFFSDDTYIWINSNDLKPLTKDDIAVHFAASAGKRRKDNLLENAFLLANDPPEMEMFVQWGSNQPTEEELRLAAEEAEAAENEEPSEDEDSSEEVIQPKRKQAKRTATSTPSRAAKKISKAAQNKIIEESKKAAERKLLEEYDSDWGVEIEEYNTETGDYIFDTPEEQTLIFESTKGPEVQDKLKEYRAEYDEISDSLVPLLLSSEYTAKPVISLVNQLGKLLKEAPKSLVLKSQLLRVLILAARKGGNDRVRKEVGKVLRSLGLDVDENPEEEIKEEKVEEIKEEAEGTKEVADEVKEAPALHNGISAK